MKEIVLVTGASRGIGAEIARLAAERGYIVCINYNQSKDAADRLKAEISEKNQEAHLFQADVTSEEQVVSMFKAIDKEIGPLDHLINNAGIPSPISPFYDITAERIRKVFEVNVVGSFLCAREACLRMSTKKGGKGGSIVNIGSGAGKLGSPGEYIDYAATKGAIDTLTIGLSKEMAGEGIRVNAVRAGFIESDFHTIAGEPNRIERFRKYIPMDRAGTPAEISYPALWLISKEASYTSGALLDVAGAK